MMTITRACAAGALIVGVAVGVAAPASAQLEEGSYTATQIGGGFAGVHTEWTLHACGPSCMTIQFANGRTLDLHLDSDTWSGNDVENGCQYAIDNKSLVVHQNCSSLGSYEKQLSKNG